MTDFQYDVFISYARADGADHAQTLRDTCRELDKRTYLDTSMIESGQKWERNLHESLLSSKAMIFVLTAGSVDLDSYCKIEWEMAVEHNIPILPVRVDTKVDFNMPKPYSTIQYIDLTNDWNAGIDEISHFLTRYDYLYELRDELNNLVASSTARRFIEIIATENAAAKKQLKRRVKVRIPKRQQTEAIEFSSFHDAWQHYNGQVLLLGAAGAGKTTTLLHYAQTLVTNYLADRNQPVPVFASIAYWDSYADQPLHEWLPEENDLPDAMQDIIDNGRAVLILDGLDELGSERIEEIDTGKMDENGNAIKEKHQFDPRLRFIKHVQTAIDMGNQILITSRITDYEDIGEKLNIKGAIELQPLTDDQIDTYLGDVPTVQTTVMADAGLLDICRSPLLLSLIAFGYRDAANDLKALPSMQEGDLRDAIFEQYITTSYDLEAQRRKLTGEEMPFTLENVMDVLGHAAMVNLCRSQQYKVISVETELMPSDLSHQLKTGELRSFITFVQHLNLIEPHNYRNYRLLHLLIRDYLAFRYSARYLFHPRYDHVYVGAVASNLSTLPHPINAVGKLGDKRIVYKLIEVLQSHKNVYLCSMSVEALGQIGDRLAVEPLLTTFQNEGDYWIRETIAQALGQIGDRLAVEPLLTTFQNEGDYWIRETIAQALGQIGDEHVVDAMIINLLNNNSPQLSARTLAQIGNNYATNVLVRTLQNDDRSRVHKLCIFALEEIGTPEALQAVAEWRAS